MKPKVAYQQPKCLVIAFTSDAIRTSGDHLIADDGDWGLVEIGETF